MIFIHARQFVEQLLHGTQHGIEKRALARKDPGHEDAHGLRYGQDHQEEQQDLKPAIRCHQNFSGFSSA